MELSSMMGAGKLLLDKLRINILEEDKEKKMEKNLWGFRRIEDQCFWRFCWEREPDPFLIIKINK